MIELSSVARGALVFASKARFGPIPLRWAYLGHSAGPVLRSLRRLWEGLGFRALREGLWCSPPRLALDRSRSAGRRGVQRFPRSLLKAFGLRMPWGVMIPVINSGGVTSKPGLRAVLVGLAIRT
jgi:hypothetical protein